MLTKGQWWYMSLGVVLKAEVKAANGIRVRGTYIERLRIVMRAVAQEGL